MEMHRLKSVNVKKVAADRVIYLIEQGVPIADTRIELNKILEDFFVGQVTQIALEAMQQHNRKDDFDEFTKLGFTD
jgi:hypothetical protein